MTRTPTPIHTTINNAIVACGKPLKTIATDLGYSNDAIIGLYATGKLPVPLDMLPALADSVGLNRCDLFVIGLKQYKPKLASIISECVTTNSELFNGDGFVEL